MPTATRKSVNTNSTGTPALLYQPTCNPDRTRENLSRLLVLGAIRDQCIESIINRLHHSFRIYSSCYPCGMWAPGLALTDEMRTVTEIYLPAEETNRAFRRLFSISIRQFSGKAATFPDSHICWLDFLKRHQHLNPSVNPGKELERQLENDVHRVRFQFDHFLPKHHGGGFSRYPAQLRHLKMWLARRRGLSSRRICCLDAACGTGEGTYDLAKLMQQSGISSANRLIHGLTIEPLELFAAAHGFFPHDPARERDFRKVMDTLTCQGALEGIEFSLGDITRPPASGETSYDVILCNGLLGGPALHGEDGVTQAVTSLAGRLRPGGIILAADRFHGGWKKMMPSARLVEIMSRCGMEATHIEDGIAATKDRLSSLYR